MSYCQQNVQLCLTSKFVFDEILFADEVEVELWFSTCISWSYGYVYAGYGTVSGVCLFTTEYRRILPNTREHQN